MITCCLRMRAAMLLFRDGGRIVAGSYSPFAATAVFGATMRTILQAITLPSFAILGGRRDQRFRAGIEAILAGTVT
ncbi:hypothetical protein G4X40_05250 [Rhodococcus sp. D2-41]|uniref:hypothetical protein n=1 Tax=Speluncibacter jeojiensis TaxID=2710754 RepID=UPI00240F182E|nr:hypothetical protein [Rhodococcus sp. D2-41]MDG3009550.1 hypothetical protein [Rhodococcus sp. D2-41]